MKSGKPPILGVEFAPIIAALKLPDSGVASNPLSAVVVTVKTFCDLASETVRTSTIKER